MTMQIYIQNIRTGTEINVTDLVIDTLELGESGYAMLNEENGTLLCQAIDIAACIAEDRFGHLDIDAYTK
jgi:hypothetical protein